MYLTFKICPETLHVNYVLAISSNASSKFSEV